MIRRKIITDLQKTLKKLGVSPEKILMEHPVDPRHGDYATNLALQQQKPDPKKRWHSPKELASQIVKDFPQIDYLEKIEIAGPGFINFWLKKEFLVNQIFEILKQKDKFGSMSIGKGKTVVIDYSSPNIAKPFGVGHLRSTNIGQALYNLYKFLGWKTVGVNHLGDWGTQFGASIVAIKKWDGKGKLDIDKLEKLYVRFHKEAQKKPELEDEARAWFKKLEDKDPEARRIWQTCVDISLREFERIYQLLDVKIDYTLGESFYEDKMGAVIEEAKRKGIAVESQGALVIEFPKLGIPPAILLKSDGATTYETRDLACIAYRKKRWNPSLYIYEVGADQKLHFQQTFAAAVKLGYGQIEQFIHVPHGLIRLRHGKFSTRKGLTIHLEDVLNEAIERAAKIIQADKREITPGEKKKIAHAVGIGAVKYSDLKQNPQTDIIFDWETIFNLEGDSGPYLQYTYARCQSVLAKAKGQETKYSMSLKQITQEEVNVLRTIYKFPEVIEEAARSFAPNLVCRFLFDLAQKYNLFYNNQSILKSDKEIRWFRLSLTVATAQVIKNGLNLLGLKALEKM